MRKMRQLLCGVFALAVLAVLPRPASAATIYAASSGSINGSLYTLDPVTGGILTTTSLVFAGGNISLTGLAFHPITGVLYASTSNASPTFGFAGHLLTVDPATGAVTDIGAFGASVSGTLSDMTFDPLSGILYGWESAGGHQLHTVNLTTGLATVVGASTTGAFGGGALAFDASGTLFASPDAETAAPGNLYTASTVTGVLTLVGPHTGVGGPIGGMDFDSAGVLYGIRTQGAFAGHLVTINPATGHVTDVGASGVTRLDALAIERTVPEPVTTALMGIGIGTLFVRSRRRNRR
jgi:hypothetical protein